jgi:hypothetical protein
MSAKSAVFKALNAVAPTFPVKAPLGTKAPYIRYLRVGGRDATTYDANGDGATSGTFQIDVFTTEGGSAERLAIDARAALYASASLTIGEVIDLPDEFEDDTKLFKVSFQLDAWE